MVLWTCKIWKDCYILFFMVKIKGKEVVGKSRRDGFFKSECCMKNLSLPHKIEEAGEHCEVILRLCITTN